MKEFKFPRVLGMYHVYFESVLLDRTCDDRVHKCPPYCKKFSSFFLYNKWRGWSRRHTDMRLQTFNGAFVRDDITLYLFFARAPSELPKYSAIDTLSTSLPLVDDISRDRLIFFFSNNYTVV